MMLISMLAFLSLLWWAAVGVWRNIGFSNGCAHTTAWGTIPLWALWLGGIGAILGLTVAVVETALGRRFWGSFGASFAGSSFAGLLAAIAGYNLPRAFITYTKCSVGGLVTPSGQVKS